MHHKRLVGQSKEIFRLRGGTHVRYKKDSRHVECSIRVGDTCHITKVEADKFGDRFEVVELPITPADVTIEEEEEAEEEAEEEEEAKEEEEVEEEAKEEEEVEEEEEAKEEEETKEESSPPPPLIDRQDFSSDNAYDKWVAAGEPDLSRIARTGHGGRTYSVKDVQNVG